MLRDRAALEKAASISFINPDPILNKFPKSFEWGEESVLSFIKQQRNFSDPILYRCYDYFWNLYKKSKLQKDHLLLIGENIQSTLKDKTRMNHANPAPNQLRKSSRFDSLKRMMKIATHVPY